MCNNVVITMLCSSTWVIEEITAFSYCCREFAACWLLCTLSLAIYNTTSPTLIVVSVVIVTTRYINPFKNFYWQSNGDSFKVESKYLVECEIFPVSTKNINVIRILSRRSSIRVYICFDKLLHIFVWNWSKLSNINL